MVKSFTIKFTKPAYRHLEAFRRFDRNRILDEIKEQLTHNPDEETRNKKLLRDNPLADWELRIHPFRVFYDIDQVSQRVRILAVGVKKREKLFIGGEEIVL
ncbi:MAG: type II toxin-antitoxin system RelE/ParE family toxin [Desulfobacterales bacterium]|nr:type II toxin-antitoxin system RelE/ParE family toxin [Desulfobacterales bacterium]